MQNVAQGNAADSPKIAENITITSNGETNGGPTTGRTTLTTAATPLSSNSSPAKSETETYSEHRRFMSDTSESEEDSVSEVESFVIDQEFEEDPQVEAAKFLLSAQEDRSVDPETQARLEALLKAAGISQFATKDGKHLADPEVLRRLTSSVSCALDEAAAALTRMRSDSTRGGQAEKTSLVEACTDGDVGTVRKLLTEGRSVHETSEEGESLLSLACSAGYYELAQVLLAMHANVEDRGIKGECTPLMEAASAGHLDIVRLLVVHGADVNAQSTSGNTPLMYGCAGGHQDVVKFLLENGANVEDHNENGHTPLMEAASAGHVGLAKILLEHGAGINTHSNEFKESALTLACYKGHLDMVKFLLEAGADQEHKTDEMHTALMEASMDGHVEVARLLLDSGAQVNMPTDSFESPLTLAACGGHVDLALLLIERGANIEEVNDEGYTPLMEAAREGHEEMVSLLLSQGANINAQTDETQETALTLACCGGFTEVADFLLKAGADIDLGASTPLMEAAQEGHLELVKYLLENNATVHAQTQTGDTALSYACENGHTDVADLLLQYGADLEHESEGGRTPLMKACRAGHLCTVQFLISKGADVRRQTSNNDHTPLSLACAGGHLSVVELLLTHRADPNHKLKDNSTMLIEAAKGGHTAVVQLLLDYPHSMNSMMLNQQGAAAAAAATNLSILPGQVRDSPLSSTSSQPEIDFFQPTPNIFGSTVLQEVPEAVRIITQEEASTSVQDMTKLVHGADSSGRLADIQHQHHHQQAFDGSLTSAEAQQVRTQPVPVAELEDHDVFATSATVHFLSSETERLKDDEIDEGGDQKKQQILEELHQVDREFLGKQQTHNHLLLSQYAVPPEQCQQTANTSLPHTLNIDIAMQQQQGLGTSMPGTMFSSSNLQVHNAFYTGATCLQSPGVPLKLAVGNESNSGFAPAQAPPTFYFAPLNSSVAVPLSSATTTSPAAAAAAQPVKVQTVASHAEVNQSTAISDRPKAKPVSKKDCKNLRKQPYQPNLYGAAQPLLFPQPLTQTQPNTTTQTQQQPSQQNGQQDAGKLSVVETVNVQQLDLETLDQTFDLKDEAQENLLTAQILHQIHNSPQLNSIRAAFVGSPVQSYPTTLDETMIATLAAHQQEPPPTDVSRVEYFAVPTGNTTQLQVQHTLYPYEHYLPGVGLGTVGTISNKEQSGAIYQAGFQAGINLMQQQLACPTVSSTDTVTTATVIPATLVPATVATIQGTAAQYNTQTLPTSCTHRVVPPGAIPTHHCQVPCTGQHHHQSLQVQAQQQQQQQAHQVQAATQTQPSNVVNDGKRQTKSVGSQNYTSSGGGGGKKKGKMLMHRYQDPNQTQQNGGIQQGQGNQIDPNAVNQYTGTPSQGCQMAVAVPPPGYCMDVDSETESNHDTALTLACAGGHEELVELLLQRGADIEHRDKKGFTPLILAATAGHEKVVEILLNHSADIEAQSERTKDTPLSLACSGGRYEVVELLLNRNANKEHRNVSDYTPLSLAASGGYVNIIKLLLNNGAEINSRTGSKLGISPLMLAAMNGHTAAVKLLLDMGSDINAQIETNRNTALTLACFQGRHEVVSLLLDRKANVEHRAKTGLTPLMEAASGGYVEVGRVLLDKGADVNATPVPSSRDTALTIAADKGHVRFVELLLCRGASVEVKNKKGNSPLWLAANGGHLSVVELLYNLNADIDSQDNRKVSCLMAAFRKGHVKVVKWMVNHVTQFPSDQEMIRYYSTISDKELLDKCQEGVNIIRAAKDTQAAKANKNATILLEELDMEKNREESKKAAAARRRERKKKKKLEKKEEKRKLHEENKKNENYDDKEEKGDDNETQDEENRENTNSPVRENEKEEGDSGIDANSQGSCSSNEVKSKEKRKDKKKKKGAGSKNEARSNRGNKAESKKDENKDGKDKDMKKTATSTPRKNLVFEATKHPAERDDFEATGNEYVSPPKNKKLEYFDATSATTSTKSTQQTSPKQFIKREEGWKEVVRKSSQPVVTSAEIAGVKKVSVPLNAISRVIGRAGSNINAIRGATGAHIEVEKQSKGQGERIITIKGNGDVVKKAVALIQALIKDPDADIFQLLSTKKNSTTTTLWDKTQMAQIKKTPVKNIISSIQIPITTTQPKSITVVSTTSTRLLVKSRSTVTSSNTRPIAPPRMIAQAEKYVTKLPTSQPNVITARITTKPITTVATETFAAKLTESTHTLNIAVSSQGKLPQKLPSLNVQNQQSIGPVSPLLSSNTTTSCSMNQLSPKHQYNRPSSAGSAPPSSHFPVPGKNPFPPTSSSSSEQTINNNHRSNTPIQTPISSSIQEEIGGTVTITMPAPQQYSLFNTVSQQSMFQQSMLRRENEQKNFAAVTGGGGSGNQPVAPFIDPETPTVDASKAPGYRGTTVSSPVSSKASSNSTTPPNLNLPTNPNFNQSNQALPPIGTNILHSTRPSSQTNQNDYFSASELTSRNIPHLAHSDTNLYKRQNKNYPTAMNTIALSLSNDPQILHSNLNFSQPQLASSQNLPPQPPTISRLNPKAPDFSSSVHGKYSMDLFNPPSSFQPGSSIGYHPMTKQQIPTFNQQRVPQSASQNRWPMMAQIQPPPYNQQTSDLMISGMAGMTIHGLARVTGGDILENGELGFSNSSPAMSPNLQPQHVIQQENHQEDRKPPPIGTERRKTYPQQPGGDHSWVNVEPKMYPTERGWMSSNMERYPPMQQKQMYNDTGIPPLMDTFQGMGMDNSHGYANGTPLPHYYQLQQQPMVNMREYPPNDQIKMGGGGSGGLSWEQSNMDLQDKQQGWPMMATKWNNP
ncbi:ankyrin repeat domain-containing protein 17 isoform X2 [Onthophagus taurus]|uniref:ankyrin repeat domain-containing protein 17 isoform X2 n=1 Tax=Onthophagus taurus TaxID=166361 RepID=UPI000C1FEB69|nr:ankyrin repeat and KH domain-containing protein 1-like isoform X2 [Onthophagus taurus]